MPPTVPLHFMPALATGRTLGTAGLAAAAGVAAVLSVGLTSESPWLWGAAFFVAGFAPGLLVGAAAGLTVPVIAGGFLGVCFAVQPDDPAAYDLGTGYVVAALALFSLPGLLGGLVGAAFRRLVGRRA